MKQRIENNGRRTALTSATIISAVIAGRTLPNTWVKPIIDSVLLPSHAQTTEATDSAAGAEDTPAPAPVVNPCSGDSLSIDSNDFAVNVIYDTLSAPRLAIRETPFSRTGPDTILSVGGRVTSFALAPFNGNWERNLDQLQEENVADGLYTRSIRRMVNGKPTGGRYEITFCIATSAEAMPYTGRYGRKLTLTLVSINKV